MAVFSFSCQEAAIGRLVRETDLYIAYRNESFLSTPKYLKSWLMLCGFRKLIMDFTFTPEM